MPTDHCFRFEDTEDTVQLVGCEMTSPFQRGSQHCQSPFLPTIRSDRVILFASEYIQLLAEDEDFEVFVIAGEAGDAEEVNEGSEQLCQQEEEHAGIVVSGLADGKLVSAKRPVWHVFGRQIGSCEVFTGHGTLTEYEAITNLRCLIRDNDGKYASSFDAVFESEGIKILRTPYQAPNANSYAERWVLTARSECLDYILIWNEEHLRRTLNEFTAYYNTRRPHQSLGQQSPVPRTPPETKGVVTCRQVLGGIINDYYRTTTGQALPLA